MSGSPFTSAARTRIVTSPSRGAAGSYSSNSHDSGDPAAVATQCFAMTPPFVDASVMLPPGPWVMTALR
ncbi:hypothetical protein JQN58_22100 [Aneurinibacillus sp. BA2021]|nr:hypothetical protein [Aneurinibacillus sp. BA2021]